MSIFLFVGGVFSQSYGFMSVDQWDVVPNNYIIKKRGNLPSFYQGFKREKGVSASLFDVISGVSVGGKSLLEFLNGLKKSGITPIIAKTPQGSIFIKIGEKKPLRSIYENDRFVMIVESLKDLSTCFVVYDKSKGLVYSSPMLRGVASKFFDGKFAFLLDYGLEKFIAACDQDLVEYALQTECSEKTRNPWDDVPDKFILKICARGCREPKISELMDKGFLLDFLYNLDGSRARLKTLKTLKNNFYFRLETDDSVYRCYESDKFVMSVDLVKYFYVIFDKINNKVLESGHSRNDFSYGFYEEKIASLLDFGVQRQLNERSSHWLPSGGVFAMDDCEEEDDEIMNFSPSIVSSAASSNTDSPVSLPSGSSTTSPVTPGTRKKFLGKPNLPIMTNGSRMTTPVVSIPKH